MGRLNKLTTRIVDGEHVPVTLYVNVHEMPVRVEFKKFATKGLGLEGAFKTRPAEKDCVYPASSTIGPVAKRRLLPEVQTVCAVVGVGWCALCVC